MTGRFLEVTYRKGEPFAAYYYLPRNEGDVAVRTERLDGGLLVDFTNDGRPMGIEITSPKKFSLELLNRVLTSIHQDLGTAQDFAPLAVA